MKARLVALAASLALVLGLATPAQADPPRLEGYVLVDSSPGALTGWWWVDEMEGIIGCIWCLHWVDLHTSHVLPEHADKQLHAAVVTGLGKLGEARVATDPAVRARLRAEALELFTVAARALGDASVRLGAAGYYDPRTGATVVTGTAWLAAAGTDVGNGLTLLQRSFADPSPQPWRRLATAAFDEAYTQIATKRVI